MFHTDVNYKNCRDDIIEYTCRAQIIYSSRLVLFFLIYILFSCVIQYLLKDRQNTLAIIPYLTIQLSISLGFYVFFKYSLKYNRKYVLLAAYINIFLMIILQEFQYIFFGELSSYSSFVIIIFISAVMVIDAKFFFLFVVSLGISIDVATTLISNYDKFLDPNMIYYIFDSLLILMFSTGMNSYYTQFKLREFAQKQQLSIIGNTDGLTKLLNRKAAENFVQQYKTNSNLCAMIIIDIDNFKCVNDELGHIKGDELLIEIAGYLKKLFRSTDCVSRLGGDEFMIFMPNISKRSDAVIKSESILRYFPIVFNSANKEIIVSCSIGIAYSDCEDENIYENLYHNADKAMYTSKKNGKNQINVFNVR